MKKSTWISFFTSLFLLHNICSAQVGPLLDLKETVDVPAENNSQAQEKAQIVVLEKYVQKFATDLIGEKKFEQNKLAIRQFALKDSGKFAPVAKAEVKNMQNALYTVAVDMKVSTSNLRQLFEKAGYLSSDVDSGVLIPFISIVDQVHTKTYKWWISETPPDEVSRELNRSLIQELQKSFRSAHFFVMNAADWNFKSSLPLRLQKDYFRKDDYLFIEKYFKFPMAVKGQVDLMPTAQSPQVFKLQVRLEVILTGQSRVIAESTRTVETEPGDIKSALAKATFFKEMSEDLADQVSAALRKGLFESSMIQLKLTGTLNYKNTENFKTTLLKSLGGLRYISEKSIESSERVYDLDYSGSAEELSQKINALKFPGFTSETLDVSQQKVHIKIF